MTTIPSLPSLNAYWIELGAGKLSSDELKIEWYKLATEFGFGVREHFSTFSINGLDENLEESFKPSTATHAFSQDFR